MSLYKRISRSFTRNILVREDDIEAIQAFMEEDPEADYYDSIYLYEEKHKEQWDRTKSLAGITDVQTNRIIFDLDSKDDLERARKDAVLLSSKLLSEGIPEESIQISFSGNKGYHIELLTDQYFSRKEIENILNHYAGDLATVDFKITDEQRIIRMPFTKHPKTGLYKTPVTAFDLEMHDSETLQQEATEVLPKHYSLSNSYSVLTPPDRFSLIKHLNRIDKQKLEQIEISSQRPDFSKKPKHLSPAKFALQEGFIPEGQSHHAFMILASTYRALGYNKEIAYNMLKATNRLRAQRFSVEPKDSSEIWNNVIQSVYGPTWKGGTYSEIENDLIGQIKKEFDIRDEQIKEDRGLVSLMDVISGFDDFATNIKKNTIKLGLNDIDKDVRLTTNMFACLLGAPSSAKTSFSFRFLNYINSIKENAVFFSLDMGSPLVFQRLLQKHTGLSSDQIFDIYENNNIKKKEEFAEILKTEYSNVKFCFESGITCEDIRARLLKSEAEGIKPKVVIIDYLECIMTPFTDQTAAKAYVSLKLKDIANEFNTCVILLVQPPKSAGDPSYPLTSYTKIKGSSVVAEQASIVLTLYRPGFSPTNPENDKYLSITVVKNRMGQLGQYDYGWEGLQGHVYELGDDERHDLSMLRKKIEAAREMQGNDGFQ
jgi:hypothetical protein